MARKPNYDRNELIDRARDLFWRRGWAGTSLKDLEATLQLNPGSFYAAFGSKEALFELAMNKYAADGAERLKNLVQKYGPIQALQRFPEMAIANVGAPAKACMLSKTLLELHAHNHPLARKANEHLLRMEVQFAELFRQAQSAGEIGSAYDPKALARRYQSDLLGLRVSAERDGVDAQAIAQEIADSLLRL
ncbi:TetR/AcrR family transcriptional regulator [Pseudorhodobacter turbinis]|uniref:TetR/AcrR family transcriptional regulator n=1 Tax=Pseudorhodobacter turbinis TaxID=2500533 RepID=A0A4P8EDE2_9RHOB|nr:TetR/AcrR family transcriptional regulator [Pseudorhodobacter turbinis]QCO54758.1 TetR/AcrR family transcriptional regulator [Pseudorhodobacter turbinis]